MVVDISYAVTFKGVPEIFHTPKEALERVDAICKDYKSISGTKDLTRDFLPEIDYLLRKGNDYGYLSLKSIMTIHEN